MDSPLLSPSKARRDAAQAKDWSYVSSWLAKKYAPLPVPRFERNDEVLQALLALVAANDVADAEAELLHQARVDELKCYEAAQTCAVDDPVQELLAEIEHSLDSAGEKALRELAETCVMLGTLETDVVTLAERLIEISNEQFNARKQLRRVSDLQAYLESETLNVNQEIEALKEIEEETLSDKLQQQTTQWNRDTKQIGMKLAEYKERISSLERVRVAAPLIEDVKADEKEVQVLQAQVKGLEKQLQELHGLPPDLEATKAEYRRSQRELHTLTRRRDELWEKVVQSR